MNFSSMEYYKVLAQERNFTRAAERLHMTQQSLSSHIAGMEKELGCQLIVRHVPLELTYAGEVLLHYATGFCQNHEKMLREIGDIAQNQKGVLRVGAAATRGQILLPETVSRFQKRFPGIRVDLIESSNEELHNALSKGTIDIAIADFPETLPGILLQDYYREEVALVVEQQLFAQTFGAESKTVEQQFREEDYSALKTCPLVLGYEDDIDGRISRDVLKQAGVSEPIVQAKSHNVGTLLELAARGVGACFCPRNIAAETLSEQQKADMLFFPLGSENGYPIRFGYKESSCCWSVVEAFLECAKTVAHSE